MFKLTDKINVLLTKQNNYTFIINLILGLNHKNRQRVVNSKLKTNDV